MIELCFEDGVAVATMRRGPVNGLNADWVKRFDAILDEVHASDAAVFLVRSDLPIFCAGADLHYFSTRFESEAGREELNRFIADMQAVLARLESSPQVSIAEVGGAAMGGGLELALACDFRLLASSASVGLPEVRIGLIPGAGGTQRLSRVAGSTIARRLILSGGAFGAAEALQSHIVDWVAPEKDIHQEALRHAARFASLSPDALAAAKTCLRAAYDARIDGFAAELSALQVLLENESTHERIRGFLRKSWVSA